MGKTTSLGHNFLNGLIKIISKVPSGSKINYFHSPDSDFFITMRKEEKPVTNAFNDIGIIVLFKFADLFYLHPIEVCIVKKKSHVIYSLKFCNNMSLGRAHDCIFFFCYQIIRFFNIAGENF